MRIIFICGCLEPGRDGVGDYTRRMATELILKGYNIFAVALNDYFVLRETYQSQHTEAGELQVLRLPSKMTDKLRFSKLKKSIENYKADLLSLQFVPYAFHAKGLPFHLSQRLSDSSNNTRWHIMLHELWIGKSNTNLGIRCLSFLQKMIIQKMLCKLNPALMHTQLPGNYIQLTRLGYKVNILPLFSNIPVFQKIDQCKSAHTFTIGVFSQIEVSDAIFQFLDKLENSLASKGIQTKVLLIGGIETKMLAFKKALEKSDKFIGQVTYTGFLTDSEISVTIKSCDLGLTAVPRHALGKSGSVMAFLAHGIPVAAPVVLAGYKASEIGFNSPGLSSSIVLEPSLDDFKLAFNNIQEAKKEVEVKQVAEKFSQDIITILN